MPGCDLAASVIIPTYNHSALLGRTLSQLARQTVPAGSFEVVVADDGSSDDTKSVVQSFSQKLPVSYYFQEDQGFRAAAARNGGARQASSPLLVFLDTGSMVGPEFVANHLAAHKGTERLAVLGMSYGYNPEAPIEGVDRALLDDFPEAVVARYKDDPEFQDIRYSAFVSCDFDLTRRAVPWMLFWTGNCSIRAADFWEVGGFDEDFRGWGGEDIELGYRLHRGGMEVRLDPAIWAVVAPHERDTSVNDEALLINMTRFLAKAPEPIVEVGWGVTAKYLMMPWEAEYQRLVDWRSQARELTVSREIGLLLGQIPEGDRVAIIGSGGQVPAELRSAALLDFDAELLRNAVLGSSHVGYHAIGIRTVMPSQAVDSVMITSRLAGLWQSWGEQILQEAARIGRRTLIAPTLIAPTLIAG